MLQEVISVFYNTAAPSPKKYEGRLKKGGGNGRTPIKLANQRHRPALFPRAEIWGDDPTGKRTRFALGGRRHDVSPASALRPMKRSVRHAVAVTAFHTTMIQPAGHWLCTAGGGKETKAFSGTVFRSRVFFRLQSARRCDLGPRKRQRIPSQVLAGRGMEVLKNKEMCREYFCHSREKTETKAKFRTRLEETMMTQRTQVFLDELVATFQELKSAPVSRRTEMFVFASRIRLGFSVTIERWSGVCSKYFTWSFTPICSDMDHTVHVVLTGLLAKLKGMEVQYCKTAIDRSTAAMRAVFDIFPRWLGGDVTRRCQAKTRSSLALTFVLPTARPFSQPPPGLGCVMNNWSREIWAPLNTQVSRADEGEARLALVHRLNVRVGEMAAPRENPPTSGIVRHDSHVRKSGEPISGNRFA
ncbi:hypothetical protein PR048_023988 [Dryococelus australis]|uniref:Uncharacterized protein n=1 Tax=Dryococelus australis TaxID=614101 RepID=A0ABQ9GVM0_9NEOP|nr:hypothetical protein PR048_023988 [Dryococelus australis]